LIFICQKFLLKNLQNNTQSILPLLRSGSNTKVAITTHHKPDADALGSSLALKHFFEAQGIKTDIISPTDFPPFLNWMPKSQEVLVFEDDPEGAKSIVNDADILFCLDFNHLSRINELGKFVESSTTIKVMIDHHQDPQGFDDYRFYTTEVSSTSELIYHFIESCGSKEIIDQSIASLLYAGIMADTGSFKYSNTSPVTHRVVANLMEAGANHTMIHQHLMDNFSLRRYRLMGYVLSEKLEYFPEYKTALIHLTAEELARFDVQTGDTEGFVNFGLGISGCTFAALIVDRTKLVKMSFRSKGDFACNTFSAKHFGGGGHINAAGGASTEPLETVVEKFKSLLPDYKEDLLKSSES
jgi:phosphoesterase RecJ-like protein